MKLDATDPRPGELSVGVVIPAHNAAATLSACLDAIKNSSRLPDRIVVVDDGSTDNTAELTQAAGVEVIATPDGPIGGAAARNLGARHVLTDLLIFIDADVAVHRETVERFYQRYLQQPDVDAMFGSYDDSPPQRNVASLFMNLRHHWVHQHSAEQAWTFWSGCGAVRRSAFEAVGGFDVTMRGVSIEDIELGMRLWRAGRHIILDPAIQCTHHKHWTIRQTVRTDIFARAIPWTRLLLRHPDLPADLNLGWSTRLSAMLVWLLLPTILLAIWTPWAWVGVALILLLVIGLNADFYGFLLKRCGWRTPGVVAMHFLYLAYSSAVFGVMLINDRLSGGADRRVQLPTPDADLKPSPVSSESGG